MPAEYRFCPDCKTKLQPFSDGERLRLYCPACGWVYYRNPTVGVAVVLLHTPPGAGSVPELLIGARRDGGWCIPCGHVEWDEPIEQAARRECLEETGLQVELEGVIAVLSNFHDPNQHTVGVWYRGRIAGGQLRAGGDLLKVRFCALDRLPRLKFPTDRQVVRLIKAEME